MSAVERNPFAVAALELYKDKLIEINTGETATSVQYSDYEKSQKHLIRGYLKDVIGDGLVIECQINKFKKIVLVNVWSIISIMEFTDNGHLSDVYVDEFGDSRVK